MQRKIKLNRGKLANLPQLDLGEPAVATDDGSLFIGTEQGNVKLAKDDEVQGISQQLADTAVQLKIPNQVDYVRDLQKLSSYKTMNLKVTAGNLKLFSVNIELSQNRGVTYEFGKDYNDDFILLLRGSVGNLNEVFAITESKNYEAQEGAFGISNPPNTYTLTVGDRLLADFYGTKITFNSFRNNQGGLWEAILDEGTAGERRKNISVFSASPITLSEQTLFEGLEERKHTITMVFKGQDPANPVSSPRGWYFTGGTRPQDTARTFNVYGNTFDIERTTDALYGRSNKEFAIEGRPLGSTEPVRYIPEHDGIGTAFNIVDSKVLVDGQDVAWVNDTYYPNIETVQVIQRVHGIHPSEPDNPLVEITHYHTVKNGVVTVSGKVRFLRDMEVTKVGSMHVPYYPDFATKIKTSIGNAYGVITDQPNYKENWVESDKFRSLAIVNDSATDEKAQVALAMTVDNFDRTFRVGEEGRGEPFSWIEHRSSTIGKVYFRTLENQNVPAGYELHFDGRYLVTLLPGVSNYVL